MLKLVLTASCFLLHRHLLCPAWHILAFFDFEGFRLALIHNNVARARHNK